MRILTCLVSTVAAGLVFGCAAIAAAGQAAPAQPAPGQAVPPAQAAPAAPANDDCLACHGDADAKRANGTSVAVDAPSLAASRHAPLACVACHTDLATFTDFPHADTLKKVTCATCHASIGVTYSDSIHARARERSGLTIAPSCANCHGSHDIRAKSDPKSRVAPAQVPVTCGVCHGGITSRYDAGVHAVALKSGNPRAPVCSTCHTSHGIQRGDSEVFKLGITAECSTCHQSVAAGFARTFHGKVSQLGSGRTAACADCHGAHDILPASNPASTVSRANLPTTCGRCHQGANASFVEYDPHPNPKDYSRSAVMWWANRFYWVLIPGCFGFFGLHSVLWFWRAKRDARAHKETTR